MWIGKMRKEHMKNRHQCKWWAPMSKLKQTLSALLDIISNIDGDSNLFSKIDNYIVFLKKSGLHIWSSCVFISTFCEFIAIFRLHLLYQIHTHANSISLWRGSQKHRQRRVKDDIHRGSRKCHPANIQKREQGDEKAKYSTAEFSKSCVVSDFIG